jgi:hypothetical protein
VTQGIERKIYGLSIACAVLTALALVMPIFVPDREGGLAGAATAVLVLLGMLLGASIVSVYLLVVTLSAYRELSFLPRLAGIAPGVLLFIGLLALLVFLRS